jgi:hypothetical protein
VNSISAVTFLIVAGAIAVAWAAGRLARRLGQPLSSASWPPVSQSDRPYPDSWRLGSLPDRSPRRWRRGRHGDGDGAVLVFMFLAGVELVALDIGRSLSVLSPQLSTMLVVMTFVTTVATAPLVRWLGKRPRMNTGPA